MMGEGILLLLCGVIFLMSLVLMGKYKGYKDLALAYTGLGFAGFFVGEWINVYAGIGFLWTVGVIEALLLLSLHHLHRRR